VVADLQGDRCRHRHMLAGTPRCPTAGAQSSLFIRSPVAGTYQDKKVVVWKLPTTANEQSKYKEILFAAPVWRVSWSVTGAILAVSSGDDVVTLWKETRSGEWESIGHVDDGASPLPAQ